MDKMGNKGGRRCTTLVFVGRAGQGVRVFFLFFSARPGVVDVMLEKGNEERRTMEKQ